jgi:hypothetical protein
MKFNDDANRPAHHLAPLYATLTTPSVRVNKKFTQAVLDGRVFNHLIRHGTNLQRHRLG